MWLIEKSKEVLEDLEGDNPDQILKVYLKMLNNWLNEFHSKIEWRPELSENLKKS